MAFARETNNKVAESNFVWDQKCCTIRRSVLSEGECKQRAALRIHMCSYHEALIQLQCCLLTCGMPKNH